MLGSMGMGIGLTKQSGLPQKFYTLSFDGGDYAETTTLTDWAFGMDNYTIAAWVKMSSATGIIITRNFYSSAGFWVLRAEGGKWKMSLQDGSIELHAISSSSKGSDWTHVAVVVDRVADTAQMIINGEEDGSPTDISALGHCDIGSWIRVGMGTLNGMTSEVGQICVWKSARTAAQLAVDMNTYNPDCDLGYSFTEGTGTTCAPYTTDGSTFTFAAGAASPSWGARYTVPPQ